MTVGSQVLCDAVWYCVPVLGGLSVLRWCSVEMKCLRHLSCDRLKLKPKHSLCQKSRILFNVVLNLMKASEN